MLPSGLALRAVRTCEKLYNMKKLYNTNENGNVEKSLNENGICHNSLSDYNYSKNLATLRAAIFLKAFLLYSIFGFSRAQYVRGR